MLSKYKEFVLDESGATAVEYGLCAALVSVAAVAALSQLGTSLTGIYNTVSANLNSAGGGT